ncbi:hypothetical protein V1522DRAFT_193155 [Lipomyces starkeyi]
MHAESVTNLTWRNCRFSGRAAESLAVSSSLRGAYSTGVSTDLNVTYISSGVKVGTRSLFSCSFNVMEYILANG